MAAIQSCDPKAQNCGPSPKPAPAKNPKPGKAKASPENSQPASVSMSTSRQLEKVTAGKSEFEKIEASQKKVHLFAKQGKKAEAKAEYEKIIQRYEKLPLNSAGENKSEWVKNILGGSAKDPRSSTMRVQAALAALGFRKNLGIYGIEGIDGKKGYFTRRALESYQSSRGIKDPREVEHLLISEARQKLDIKVQSEANKAKTVPPSPKAQPTTPKKASYGLKSLEKSRAVTLNSKAPTLTPKSQFESFVQKYNETLQTGRDAMKFDPKSPEFISTRQKFVRQVDATVAAAKQLGMSKEKVSQLVKDLFKPLVKEEAASINARSKEQKRDLANHYGLQPIARNLSLEIKRDEPGNRWIRERIHMLRSNLPELNTKRA